MECNGCGNKDAVRWQTGFEKGEDGKLHKYEVCNACGLGGSFSGPDVYWDGKPEHGLPDDPITGKPRVFASKGEKAAFLRQHNLVEAGDKIRGSRPTITRFAGTERESRDEAAKALAQVKQMGQDVKRREIHRILKQSEGLYHGR